jgi:hypothetical protein
MFPFVGDRTFCEPTLAELELPITILYADGTAIVVTRLI